MITIIYNKTDYAAADIAIKVLGLTKNIPVDIYVIQRNGNRKESAIAIGLSKTTHAIFISFDGKSLDDQTEWEMEYLQKQLPSARIKWIVPSKLKPLSILSEYNKHNSVIEFDKDAYTILLINRLNATMKPILKEADAEGLKAYWLLVSSLIVVLINIQMIKRNT